MNERKVNMNMHRTSSSYALLVCIACAIFLIGPLGAQQDLDVTFFVTSDAHYQTENKKEHRTHNNRIRAAVREMNRLPGDRWPDKLGGGVIDKTPAVPFIGDMIDNGHGEKETKEQWAYFIEDFGLTGNDGRLNYPVFEGVGNHDGPPPDEMKEGLSTRKRIIQRNRKRKKAGFISNLSDNGLHYSWDWGPVHFLQLNLYPGDKPHPKTRYSKEWHHPQGALTFMKRDLKAEVGNSGRPVVIMAHYGFDCLNDWWRREEAIKAYRAMKPYRIAGYFHGHTGTGLYSWSPKNAEKDLRVVNTGQTDSGFFVVRIKGPTVRVAFRELEDLEKNDWTWNYIDQWKWTEQ